MAQTTRRNFLTRTAGGIVLAVTPLSTRFSGAIAAPSMPPSEWQNGPGKARQRMDGLRKVLGQKVYARDFRPRDLEGWPKDEEVVLVLRCPFANRQLLGLDFEALPAELKPTQDHYGYRFGTRSRCNSPNNIANCRLSGAIRNGAGLPRPGCCAAVFW